MKRRNLLLVTFLSIVTSLNSFSQTNLGQDCGCPAVGSRPRVDLPAHISADMTLTCENTYYLVGKTYVDKGATLTINPGALIKGRVTVDVTQADKASALIVSRGAKIMALGTRSCPIVFTDSTDLMNGTSPLTQVGKWGGIAICGTAANNLTLAQNSVGNCVLGDGIGWLEGYTAAHKEILYGAGAADTMGFTVANDADNSGKMTFVSIRHPGANIKPGYGNELNGLTLASVGSGTVIENIEVVASADDSYELFGGTVNLKNCASFWGDDDQLDYDQGYRGNVQFFFSLATDSVSAGTTNFDSNDNGIEADSDDKNRLDFAGSNRFMSRPVIKNATFIGNGHILGAADNLGPAGIMAKECAGGVISNCLFVNYRTGVHLSQKRSVVGTYPYQDSYDKWLVDSLKICGNTFVNCGGSDLATPNTTKFILSKGANTPTTYSSSTGLLTLRPLTLPAQTDLDKFSNDCNVNAGASLTGIDFVLAFNAAKTALTNQYSPSPRTNILPGACCPVNNSFFVSTSYRGAFDAKSNETFLSTWAQNAVKSLFQSHPTDFDQDGDTDVADYNVFVGSFGSTY